MKILRYVLAAAVLLVAAGAGTAALLLRDANRFKPRLESLIETRTGVPLEIGGDLSWRLWPPVSISAESLRADYEGQTWQVGRLSLDLAALELLGGLDQWRVQTVNVEDVRLTDEASVLEISRARLEDLAPRRPAPVAADLIYTAEGQPPRPVSVRGLLAVDPDTLDLSLDDTRIETVDAAGTCDAEASPVADPPAAPPATGQDLIPVAVFRSFDWAGECLLDWVQAEDQRFENVTLRFDNSAGDSHVQVDAPEVFGGQAVVDVAVDARREPVRWTVAPTLTGVDSARLLAWLDQRLTWAAPLAYGGTLRFEGNTAEELLASMSGETRFDGGQGRIDIAAVKSELLTLANRFNEGERIARWPDMWQYQRLVGEWRIERQHHVIDLALDNLKVAAEGDYSPESESIDVLLELVFGNDPAWPVFEMNPVLYDLPIPIRCRGDISSPTCRVDQDAAQRIVAQVLTGENPELRSRLEQKIDEEVPEQYRDAARSLLDMLGGSRETAPR